MYLLDWYMKYIRKMCTRTVEYFWWLVRVTLVVDFGFLPQHFGSCWGGGAGPTNNFLSFNKCRFSGGGYHEVVGTLKPYNELKNLFEFKRILRGDRDHRWKNFGHKHLCLGARDRAHCLRSCPEPSGETFTIYDIIVSRWEALSDFDREWCGALGEWLPILLQRRFASNQFC